VKWALFALLLIFAAAYSYLGLKEWEPKGALVNVRGSAAVVDDLPYTLNLQQQKKLLAAYNSGKKVSTPPQTTYEGKIEHFWIYTFEQEEPLKLTPLSNDFRFFQVDDAFFLQIKEREGMQLAHEIFVSSASNS